MFIALVLVIQPAAASVQFITDPGYEYEIGSIAPDGWNYYEMHVTSSDDYDILALIYGEANNFDLYVTDPSGATTLTAATTPYSTENGLTYIWAISTTTPGTYRVAIHSVSGAGKFAFIHFYNRQPIQKPVGTSTIVPVSTPVTQVQDPIIGVWRFSYTNYDFRYQFNADGTYVENLLSVGVFYGTWRAQGGNSYILYETATGTTETIIYNPAQKSLYSTTYPTLIYTPYAGNAPSPDITTTVPTTVTTTVPTTVKTTVSTTTTTSTWWDWEPGWAYDYDPSQLGAPSSNAKAWKWTFGDGGTSTQRSGTHQYTSEGDWTVRLTVTYEGGSTRTFSTEIKTRRTVY